jgi:nitrate reductase NapE component
MTVLHGLFLVSLVAAVAGLGWLAWMFDRG